MRAHHTVARGKKTTSFTERNLRPQCACRQCTAVNVGSGGKERRRASVGVDSASPLKSQTLYTRATGCSPLFHDQSSRADNFLSSRLP